jgi:23S rRNA-/tRNA-specific pseudouridylate synthase
LMIWKTKNILTRLVNDMKKSPHPNPLPWGRGNNKWVIKKTYYAIVLWKLPKKKWTITKKLLRIENAKNENKVQVNEKWLTAISHYKLIKEHILQTKEWVLILSEVEIDIETWRMHQIRVHMASLGNPILWDKAYWDKRLNSFFERNFWLKRQALHAWKIEFFHYGRDKIMKLEARLKEDLVEFINKIKK